MKKITQLVKKQFKNSKKNESRGNLFRLNFEEANDRPYQNKKAN